MKKPVLHWIKEGQGPLVVLSHSLGCDVSMWDEVTARLRSSFTVLRYDHRGHGQSEAVPGPYTMEMIAEDAAVLIAAQASGPVHFVGLSMGGMVAQVLGARHPSLVKSLVIANSTSWYGDEARVVWDARIKTVLAQGVAAISEGAMQRWFTPEFRSNKSGAERVAALRKRLDMSDAAAYAANCEAVAAIDFRESNRQIRCPTLVIAGTRDEGTPLAMSELIRDTIPGAQLRTIDAAHISAVEQPEVFSQLVKAFIESVEAAVSGKPAGQSR